MEELRRFWNMNQIKIIFTAIAIFIGIAICGNNNVYAAEQADVTVGGVSQTWSYNVENGEATLYKLIKYDGTQITEMQNTTISLLRLPGEINGYTVTGVGDGKERLIAHDNFMKSLEIPASVKSINANAFDHNESLRSVVFYSGSVLESIGDYAFRSTIELKTISVGTEDAVENCLKFPSSLKTIGKYAFEMNPRIQHHKIVWDFSVDGDGKTVIPYEKGAGWAWYTSVVPSFRKVILGSNMTNVDDFAFAGCKSLSEVIIPNTTSDLRIGKAAFSYTNAGNPTIEQRQSTLTIDDFAFSYASSPNQNIVIPDNVILKDYVFKKSTFIKKVTVGNSVLGENDFDLDNNLEEIELSDTIKVLPKNIFEGCDNLKKVTAPGVTIIEEGVFSNKNNITTLTLGTLKYLGDSAFSGSQYITPETYAQLLPSTHAITLGKNVFTGCTGLTGTITLNMNNNSVTENGKEYQPDFTGAFVGCKNITKGVIVSSDSITQLPSHIFAGCTSLQDVDFPNTVKTIGSTAFESCTSITNELLNNKILTNITEIQSGAFYNDTGITGEFTIPENIKVIGNKAFENTGITKVNYNTALESLGAYAVPETREVLRMPSTHINSLSSNAFTGVREIFFEVENVAYLGEHWNGPDDVIIHYKNHKHHIDVVNSLPGVKLINVATNEELTEGDFACESNLTFRVQIEDGYSYPDLKVKVISGGQYAGSELTREFVTLNSNNEYTLENILRDKTIVVQKDENQTDLEVRTFITKINGVDVEPVRKPEISTTRKVNNLDEIKYQHIKLPLTVRRGDLITYKIRVYNEGDSIGKVKELKAYIQDGLEVVNNERVNWTVETTNENGSIVKTSYLNDKDITRYRGEGKPEFEEVELTCRVTKEEKNLLTVITELADSNDVDSVGNNVSLDIVDGYKRDESNTSYETSYIKSAEDDTDYESVSIKNVHRVGYTIALEKIDSTSLELLNGAKFNLYNADKELIESQVTVNDGKLEFNERVSYGEGTDTYYIEEVETPPGYKRTIDGLMELTVKRTISGTGDISLEIICNVDERYDFGEEVNYIPITTAEQLKKIGSNEILEINGVSRQFAPNASYELVNDIDLAGQNWTPISNFTGLLEGNNHKIKNLTIHKTVEYTPDETYCFGLFANMSGYVRNLTLDNVDIEVNPDTAETDRRLHELSNQISEINSLIDETERPYKYQLNELYSQWCDGLITDNEYSEAAAHITAEKNAATENLYAQKNQLNAQRSELLSNSYYADSTNNYNNFRIGAFAGNAGNDGTTTFENCIVSGIIESVVSNVGGFVGHTAVGPNLKFKNCANNANVSGADNIGGLVGCTKGDTDLIKCVNNGNITSSSYNAGGLIGIAIPQGQTPENIVVGYDSVNSRITIAVKNKMTVTGNYNLILEKIDKKAGIYLDGAKFDIYDEEMNVLQQNAVARDGKIEIADLVINSLKTDVFYIKEVEAPVGYDIKVKDYVKVVVRKTWNSQKEQYEITVEPTVTSGITETSENNIRVGTGATSDIAESGVVRYGSCRVKASECINNGDVTSYKYSVGGIVGTIKGVANIDKCQNLGKVSSTSNENHIGGIIGDLIANPNQESRISNSANGKEDDEQGIYGVLEAGTGWSGTLDIGGIVGISQADLVITNCNNYSNISGIGHIGGIIAKSEGRNLTISNCNNYGDFDSDSDGGTVNKGGIIGTFYGIDSISKDYYTVLGERVIVGGPSRLHIDKCYSEGNIKINASGQQIHIGGIIGAADCKKNSEMVQITNCTFGNDEEIIKFEGTGDTKGGIAGKITADTIIVLNNTAKNISFVTDSWGDVGGLIGELYNERDAHDTDMKTVVVDSNNVYNISITGTFKDDSTQAGLIGQIVAGDTVIGSSPKGNASITNNTVNTLKIAGETSTMVDSAGFIGFISGDLNVNINNCKVMNIDIGVDLHADQRVSGFIGMTRVYSVNMTNCELKSTNGVKNRLYGKVESYRRKYDGTMEENSGNTNEIGGMIGFRYDGNLSLSNCNVSQTEIEKVFNNSGRVSSTAGVIGHSQGGDIHLTQIALDDVTIKVSDGHTLGASSETNQGVGGIVGTLMDGSNSTIQNIEINNSKIIANSQGDIGGIIGTIPYGSLTIDKFNMSNFEIQGEVELTGGHGNGTFGGILGAGKVISLSNGTINNLKIKTLNNYADSIGGLFGWCSTSSISNININGLDIDCSTMPFIRCSAIHSVGGLVGTSDYTMNVEKVVLNNAKIKANDSNIGGFFGYLSGKINMTSDCVIQNETLETIGYPTGGSYNGALGGMVGTLENYNSSDPKKELKGVVNNVTINVPYGITAQTGAPQMSAFVKDIHTGGVVGFAKGLKLTNGLIVDTVKINNNSLAGCVGGIVGDLYYDSIVESASISNFIGNGNHNIGGIAGFTYVDIKNATVRNMDTLDDTFEAKEYGYEVDKTQIDMNVGGIVGNNNYHNVDNCTVTADEGSTHTLKSKGFVGGLVGFGLGADYIKNSNVSNITVMLDKQCELTETEQTDAQGVTTVTTNLLGDAAELVGKYYSGEPNNCIAHKVKIIKNINGEITEENIE